MRAIQSTFLSLLFLCQSGCVSMDGYRIIEKDGKVTKHHIGGIPIVIQRPNRAIFVITTTTYSVERLTIDNAGTPVIESLPDEVNMTISDEPVLLGPSEVYSLDFKRPASGTIDYSMELSNYYPTKLGAKLDDKTLAELRKLAGDLIEKFVPDGGVTKEAGGNITRTPRAVSLSLVIFDLEQGTASRMSF